MISASTRAALEFDFGFETFGEKKLCEMLSAAKDYVREMGLGATPRWLSFWDGAARERLPGPWNFAFLQGHGFGLNWIRKQEAL